MAIDHSGRALELAAQPGHRTSLEETPVAVAELLAAQVHATLAVADAIDRLIGFLEDRAVTVGSE